jgi:ABC-type spermidine/putrescine transport system permease subunit I
MDAAKTEGAVPIGHLVQASSPAGPRRTGWEEQRSRVTRALLVVPVASMVLLFILPLVVLLWMSFGGSEGFSLAAYAKLGHPLYLRLLGLTLQLALVVTIVCMLLAYPIAYLLANLEGRLNRWIVVALFVSLWLSFLARTFTWIIILQRNGIINQTLVSAGITSGPLQLIYNQTGVYIGMIHILLPFMIVTLVPALRAIDGAYIRASLSLGLTPWATFWKVYFPLSMPGVVAGNMLVFTLAFGFFITPAILGGGRVPTIVLAIKDQVQSLADLQLASATSMVLLLFCLALLFLYDRVAGVDRIYDRGR